MVADKQSPVADSALQFIRSRAGKPEALLIGTASLPRQRLGPAEGGVFRITPIRPVADAPVGSWTSLRRIADEPSGHD